MHKDVETKASIERALEKRLAELEAHMAAKG
jgi:hypothetical protein